MNLITEKDTKIIKISHIVNSVFTSRTYILSNVDNTEFWLVDCGDVPPIMDYLSTLGDDLQLDGVLLTHAHYDHIYGLPRLKELYPSIKVYTNERGKQALADERFNYSKYHEDPIVYTEDKIVICNEGMVIDLFDGILAKVYHTPGHNPSCLTFEIGDYLFTGDAYIPGIPVVTTLKGGDKKMAVASVERIIKLSKGKIICPGHEITTLTSVTQNKGRTW